MLHTHLCSALHCNAAPLDPALGSGVRTCLETGPLLRTTAYCLASPVDPLASLRCPLGAQRRLDLSMGLAFGCGAWSESHPETFSWVGMKGFSSRMLKGRADIMCTPHRPAHTHTHLNATSKDSLCFNAHFSYIFLPRYLQTSSLWVAFSFCGKGRLDLIQAGLTVPTLALGCVQFPVAKQVCCGDPRLVLQNTSPHSDRPFSAGQANVFLRITAARHPHTSCARPPKIEVTCTSYAFYDETVVALTTRTPFREGTEVARCPWDLDAI